MQSSYTSSQLSVMFDDDHAVANVGFALVGLLSEKLPLEDQAKGRPRIEKCSVGPRHSAGGDLA
jgi:hypothetical protein